MNKMIRILLLALCVFTGVLARAYAPSGTLPVMYITTENEVPITDKETYLKGSYKIDPMGIAGVEALSGTLQIKGRGNYTWKQFDKKPYRIKLDEKAKLLGFKKSKHFVLLAHADDNLGFMRDPAGFKMSELAGMAWTPGQKPLELIVNGDYRGLYFLVENIRIDKDRVDIFNQEDENPSTDVTGGWLCEIDNYVEPADVQITITEGNGQPIKITHHNPEEITAEQEAFLRAQMEAIDRAFYIQDTKSREYEELVDLKSLASFYVIQEVLDNIESFWGSCYIHRERGEGKKWVWGPVWDFGDVYSRREGRMFYEAPNWGIHWIDQIVKFESFQEAVKTRFADFVENELQPLRDYLSQYSATLVQAAKADAERWPEYSNPDILARVDDMLGFLNRRMVFLGQKWVVETNVTSGMFVRGDVNGWEANSDFELDIPVNGVYSTNFREFTGRFKITDQGGRTHSWGTAIPNQEIPLDTPIELINGSESNEMITTGGFKSIIFRILDSGDKATIELSTKSAVTEIFPDKQDDVAVEGRRILIRNGNGDIYDIYGRCVASETSEYEGAPGLYIVITPTRTSKIILK